MERARKRKINFINIIRYILAIPVAFILFYIIGEIMLIFANWSYIIELNKFLVLPVIFIKNVVLAMSLYIIIPNFKKVIVIVIGAIMIILSMITAYLYITNGEASFASIYIIQMMIWIGIIIYIYFKFPHK